MKKTIFITGATGNIGAKLTSHILSTDPASRLILLVRGRSHRDACERLERILRITSPEFDLNLLRTRAEIVCGDITRNSLGLSNDDYKRISGRITHIIHSAAATKFNISLQSARTINVEGTLNVMKLALKAQDAGNLEGVAYLSTAYVCGTQRGTIMEEQTSSPDAFSNAYEQSKWESEGEVGKLRDRLPITVFRPSIVVGDSRTGRIATLNVLYTPLRFICRGLVSIVPGHGDVPLDVVPVDYVAKAIAAIFLGSDGGAGRCFNLVAGEGQTMTSGQVLTKALAYFASNSVLAAKSKIRFLPPVLFRSVASFLSGRSKKMLEQLGVFTPYISLKRTFDDTNTRQALRNTGVSVPKLSDYLNNILAFCLETGWGRKTRQAA
ncbi:MAG: SDR family oxidoreductase [Candidatus Zixiibacteriota bacterium]|nr:MAG: SDR family oxidoreductase [candidate division Zixibacteria bacterium]